MQSIHHLISMGEAASSWMWHTGMRPWHFLPAAFLLVLLADLLILRYGGGILRWKKLIPAVVCTNAVCFLLPYGLRWMGFLPLYGCSADAVTAAFRSGPFYLVDAVLIVAIALKLLLFIVFFWKDTLRRGSVMIGLTAANAALLGLTAWLERLLCSGLYI